MINFIIVVMIAYMCYGLAIAFANKKKITGLRIITIFDWPWLIYTKEGTTA